MYKFLNIGWAITAISANVVPSLLQVYKSFETHSYLLSRTFLKQS